MQYQQDKVRTGITINYATAGDREHTCVVLIHGYPNTSYQYRKVVDRIASAGYFVVVPDYRGAGQSEMTETGYDKFTMGADIHSLYKDVLKKEKAIIVGIDIGSMVATALALRFREDVIALFASECPQPGTSMYDKSVTDDEWKYKATYHFFFHMAPNNWAENLTVGKEKYYINSFYERLAGPNKSYLSSDELDEYTRAFAGFDRMRAGFEVYRAFLQDCADVKQNIAEHGKLTIPVLASGGADSAFTGEVKAMMEELANNVAHEEVPGCGHWMAEEAPEAFVKVLVGWMNKLDK